MKSLGALFEANQIKIDAAAGTPPLIVNSSVMVANLNAQYLGGYASSDFLQIVGGIVTGELDLNMSGSPTYAFRVGSSGSYNFTVTPNGNTNVNNLSTSGGVSAYNVTASGPVTCRGFLQNINTTVKTGAYTVSNTDNMILCSDASGTFTVTLPNASYYTGQEFTIKRISSGSNHVTVATTSSQTIDGLTTYLLNSQWQTVTVVSNGTGWYVKSKV